MSLRLPPEHRTLIVLRSLDNVLSFSTVLQSRVGCIHNLHESTGIVAGRFLILRRLEVRCTLKRSRRYCLAAKGNSGSKLSLEYGVRGMESPISRTIA